jgi:hypothetical protein
MQQTQEEQNTSSEHGGSDQERRQVNKHVADHKTCNRRGKTGHDRLQRVCPRLKEGNRRIYKFKQIAKRHRNETWRGQHHKSGSQDQEGETIPMKELRGGRGEDLRSLPQALGGHDTRIMPCCAGPQYLSGKNNDDVKGYTDGARDEDGRQSVSPNTHLLHVRLPGDYNLHEEKGQQEEGEETGSLERGLILGRQEGCTASRIVRGGLEFGRREEDRDIWLHAARAGVG